MPVDLPVRKALSWYHGLPEFFDEWGAVLAALCFAVALLGLMIQTPRHARASLPVATYEAMLLSP